MSSEEIQAAPAPPLNIPDSPHVCEISIINTTLDLSVPSTFFGRPTIKGHEIWNMPTFSFYIKNKKTGKEILFDIGAKKDWWNHSPIVDGLIRNVIPGLNIKYNVNEILELGGVNIANIQSVIWSHWHWDHIGDMTQFPPNVEVVVGPEFKEKFLPGYPENPESPMLAQDFAGRNVRQINFDQGPLKIGQFRAHDFFGDGSFYILDVPGHAVGHISGLVRTTPDTFAFLGGDVCHYGGMHKPTKYLPMPTTIPKGTPLEAPFSAPCPCSLFVQHHPAMPDEHKARTTPFYAVTEMQGSWYMDPPLAQDSINKMAEFDAHDNVFVLLAHDPKLIDVCDWFPKATINDWKAKGWKKIAKWGFLNELPDGNGKPTRGWLAKGLCNDGHQHVPPQDKWKNEGFNVWPETVRPSWHGKSGI